MTNAMGPRILGLDLSLTATGMALPDGTTETVRTRQADGWRRLMDIRQRVSLALGAGVDLAVLEDLPTHAKAAGITGRVHGAVLPLLMSSGVPFVYVVPSVLKKYATGSGNADKAAVQVAAFKRFGAEFADDNQCDAAWLRWLGLDAYGAPACEMPAAQRAALTKVVWPTLPVQRSAAVA